MKLNHKDIYQSVTDSIVLALEAGTVPWVRPWSAAGWSAPMNWLSGRPYSGINALLLTMAGAAYGCGEFATFKQIREAGGQVRKGESGHHVIYWNTVEREDKETGDKVAVPFAKLYTVFNLAQADGVEPKHVQAPQAVNPDERREDCDALMTATGAQIQETDGGSAHYNPKADAITLPRFAHFRSAGDFYATAFHELTHWTAHRSRLDRDLSGRFGSQAYAAEELVAELGAAFLCARQGVDGQLQHAEYIGQWLRILKEDKRAIFTAASQAEKAARFLADNTG